MYRLDHIEASLAKVLDMQEGVLARDQAIGAGLSRHVIAAHVKSGRWQRMYPGVFVTFSGPIPRPARLWGAVLCAGGDAVLSYHSAAELWGLADPVPAAIDVSVPRQAGPLSVPGVVLHHSARLPGARHPARLPSLTKLEETALDLADLVTSAEDAVAWPIRACQRRLTTPARIAEALTDRARARWRADLAGAIAVLEVGCRF